MYGGDRSEWNMRQVEAASQQHPVQQMWNSWTRLAHYDLNSQTLPEILDVVEDRTFNVSGRDQSGPQDQKEHHESSDLGGWCGHSCAYCEGVRGDCHDLCLRWPENFVCRIFWARGYLNCRIAPQLLSGNPRKPRWKNGKAWRRPSFGRQLAVYSRPLSGWAT